MLELEQLISSHPSSSIFFYHAAFMSYADTLNLVFSFSNRRAKACSDPDAQGLCS